MILVRAATGGYTALVFGAVLIPALAVRAAGDRGGSGVAGGEDLFAVSVVLAVVAAVLARRRLRGGRPTAPPTDRWLAALVASGVLGGGAAGLPTLALYATARLPAGLTGQPWLAPALWAAGLLLAVLVSAGTDRAVSRWLDHERSEGRSGPVRGSAEATEQEDRASDRAPVLDFP